MRVRGSLRSRQRPQPERKPGWGVPGRGGLPRGLRSLARPAAVVAAVLALIFVVGWLRFTRHSGGVAGSLEECGLWPVGFGAGLAVLALTRRQRGAAAAAVALVTLAAGMTAGVAGGASAALALGAGVEAWVLAGMLARDPDGRARLIDLGDLIRLVWAGAVAALAGMAILGVALVSGLTGESIIESLPLLPVIAISHLLSHVLVVPFFLRIPDDPPTAGRGEVALQAVLAVVVTPLLFIPEFPGTVFLAFPLLAWGATRCGFRSALAQPVLLGVVAAELTIQGLGPFDASQADLPSPLVGVLLLQGYVLSGAAVTLPLAIAIALQHRRADEVIEERQRAEGLVRSTVGTAIVATDLSGRVRLANPGAAELFGYDAATLSSLSVADLFPENELADQARGLGVEPELRAVMDAMSATPGERREWVVRRADGEARGHLLGFAHLADDRGGVSGFVLTSEDITERIRVHESLVAALVAEHEVVQRLEELDGVKEALVSTVSHELRTPITSILGHVELLQDGDYGELTKAQAHAIDRVSDNGRRLLTLIDDLLILSRLQNGVVDLELRPFDLREAVRAAWEVLETKLRGRDLAVSMQLADGPTVLEGDKNQLERLVANLIGNAIKFTPDGGRVVVRLTQRGERLLLEVSDTGIGIPEDEQEQLFSRFFRSRLASERAIQGTGLGLSIVQAIAEQHGGRVSAESKPGHGTTFRVELPASEPASVDVALPPPPPAESAPVSAAEDEVGEVHAESASVLAESAPVSAAAEEVGEVHAESAPVSVAAEEVGEVHADSAGVVAEEVGEVHADSAFPPQAAQLDRIAGPAEAETRSVEELLAAMRAAASPEAARAAAGASAAFAAAEPEWEQEPESEQEPEPAAVAPDAGEPEVDDGREPQRDRPSAATRLAAARRSAPGYQPDESARAILEALGSTPGHLRRNI